MGMNYKARQNSMANKDGKKLWHPVIVKDRGPVTTKKMADKIAEKSTLTRGDVFNVIDALINEFNEHLMNGRSVQLEGLGTFTAIAKTRGTGVEKPEEVNHTQIKALRIQFTPAFSRSTLQGVTRILFEGVKFTRWLGDPYNPQNPENKKANANANANGNANGNPNGTANGDEVLDDPTA